MADTAWMIELSHGMPMWYTGFDGSCPAVVQLFSMDPCKTVRYPTKEAAEHVRHNLEGQFKFLRGKLQSTEHEWSKPCRDVGRDAGFNPDLFVPPSFDDFAKWLTEHHSSVCNCDYCKHVKVAALRDEKGKEK